MKTTLPPSTATSVSAPFAELDLQAVEQDWPFFVSLLPADWEAQAQITGGFQRKRLPSWCW